MGLFRRAKVVCPECGKEIRKEVGERHFFSPKPKPKKWAPPKIWEVTCKCGAKISASIEPAWWMGYVDPDGRYRRQKIGANRRKAQSALEAVRTEVTEGKYVDRKKTCKMHLGELCDKYLEHIKPDRTLKNYRAEVSALGRVRKGMGAGIRMDRIGESQFDAYRKAREKDGVTCGTINRELSCLGAAMTYAVKRKWLTARPKITLPNPQNERERFLSKPEASRLVEACPDHIRPIVRAALATGMRLGELVKMEWSWLDLGTGDISIPAKATKSKRGRHVPINEDLREVFETCRDRAEPGNPRVFVFGGRVPKSIWYTFKKAAKAAGIEDWKALRFHDLRHTAASWMVQGGEPLFNVAVILGHRSLAMTQRYAHFATGHLKSAVEHTRLDVEDSPKDTRHEAEEKDSHQALTSKIVPFPSAANSRG